MLCGRGLSVMRIIIVDRNGIGHWGYDCDDNIRKLVSKKEREWVATMNGIQCRRAIDLSQWPVQLQCLWRLLEGVEWIEAGRKTLHAMLRP